MTERASRTTTENMEAFLATANLPQSVFFYIVLGMISGARKLLLKSVGTGCPEEEAGFTQRPPVTPR